MAENQSQPRSSGSSNPGGGPKVPGVAPEPRAGDAAARPSDTEASHEPDEGRRNVRAPGVTPEPRSFGSDDMEGVRSDDADKARRFADYGGQDETEADRMPSGVSRTPG